MFKKTVKNFLLLFFLFALSSCITKSLWSNGGYEENIKQFYIGSDGRYVALIGSDYHYILRDESGVIKKILSLRQKGVLTLDRKLTNLKLNSNNEVYGVFALSGPFNLLPKEDAAALANLGFYPNRADDIAVTMQISGRRYAARYLSGQALSETDHVITVDYSDSNVVKNIGKAAITPITVTLDAVVLIGKIVVSPFNRD